LGRVLAAMRDSDTAARSIGIDLRAYKLFIFGASSFIAGVGRCLLAEQARVFNAVTGYDLFTSLFWFVVVIVAGVGSIGGAVLGAVIFELLDHLVHVDGLSQLLVALGALFIGYLPGASLVGMLSRIASSMRAPAGVAPPTAGGVRRGVPVAVSGSGRGDLVPSDFALRLLEEAQSA